MDWLSPQLALLLLIVGGAALHGLVLALRVAREQGAADTCAHELSHAKRGGGGGRYVWRDVPAGCDEGKLVLAYEPDGRHKVLQYPVLRPGHHVRFSNGRVHLMTDSALEKTLEADDALRDKLGLEPVED